LFADDGEILIYTNSLEAIEQNYRKGHRVFEIDFNLTKDARLAAVHYWGDGKKMTNSDWEGAPTLEEWKSRKIYGKYTPIDINDIVKLMETYEDIYIVTDTKETDKDLVVKQFMEIYKAAEQVDIRLLDRFIPQIYYPRMLETIYDIYAFKNVIYTLYMSPQPDDAVLDFVENHGSIFAVTMWPWRATEDFVRRLNESGKRVYVHTINKFQEAYDIMKRGVYGLYTDYLY
jgi:glycerophosphoryl diester phosphodiesterase